jgi:hypothetical protein
MALKSHLFRGSRGLAACEINDAARLIIGKQGDDVGVDLDANTLIHEMIHAALPTARTKVHDPENFSVFFPFGHRTGRALADRAQAERAADLSNAFFASKP